MKYWKRITDAGCRDSASAYDRKRALDPRGNGGGDEEEKNRGRGKKKSGARLIRDTSSLLRRISPRAIIFFSFFREIPRFKLYRVNERRVITRQRGIGVTSRLKSWLGFLASSIRVGKRERKRG